MKIVKVKADEVWVLSKYHYVVAFSSQITAKQVNYFEPRDFSHKSVQDAIDCMVESNFKYGITRDMLNKKFCVEHSASNPFGFSKIYPEYFI